MEPELMKGIQVSFKENPLLVARQIAEGKLIGRNHGVDLKERFRIDHKIGGDNIVLGIMELLTKDFKNNLFKVESAIYLRRDMKLYDQIFWLGHKKILEEKFPEYKK